ncbi:MAG: hypothetical protein ACI8V2_002662 [Candidatus Latescibacterota bacterium]|jgi:hypothetical protein
MFLCKGGGMQKVMVILMLMGGTAFAQVSPVLSLESDPQLLDVVCRACAHFNPDALPSDSPYHLDRATCGTMAVMGLRANWDKLSPATKTSFSFLFQQSRPTRTASAKSASGRFDVHYNTSGFHAVSLVDGDANGIPDYVDETIKAFDASWDRQITQLGYNPPPSDGDGVYDIYISSLGTQSVYGLTWPGGSDTVIPSHIEIDNNFTDANVYFTQGIDGLKVTAAHEFFHAIQFGYYADFGASWWQEMTATWMEDVVYPDINDFYAYLPGRLNDPEASIDAGGIHPFGGAVYAHHMEQVYGIDAVRIVWESLLSRAPKNYQLSEINLAMPGGEFANVLPRYAVWNYLTNTRARPNYYVEAADILSVKHRDLGASGSGTGSATVDHLGATYVRVETAGLSGGLRGIFTLSSASSWTFVVALVQASRIELLWPQSGTVVVPNVNRFQEVVFIPIVTSLTDDNLRVDYTISSGVGNSTASDLVADFDNDGNVNFNDFLTFADGFGVAPLSPSHNPRSDLNGDGPVDFHDFLLFASHFGESR